MDSNELMELKKRDVYKGNAKKCLETVRKVNVRTYPRNNDTKYLYSAFLLNSSKRCINHTFSTVVRRNIVWMEFNINKNVCESMPRL